jgi:hypothetical protein
VSCVSFFVFSCLSPHHISLLYRGLTSSHSSGAAVVASLNRVGLVMHLIKAAVVRVRKRYGERNMLESLSSRMIPTRGTLRTMLL